MKKHKLFIVEFRDSSIEAKVYARTSEEAKEKAALIYKSANFGRCFTVNSLIPEFILKQPTFVQELYDSFDFHKTIFICRVYDFISRIKLNIK